MPIFVKRTTGGHRHSLHPIRRAPRHSCIMLRAKQRFACPGVPKWVELLSCTDPAPADSYHRQIADDPISQGLWGLLPDVYALRGSRVGFPCNLRKFAIVGIALFARLDGYGAVGEPGRQTTWRDGND